MRTRRLAPVLALAIASPIIASAAPAAAAVASFHSPSGNTQCEVGWKRASVGTYAYGQTATPARSVRLRRSGSYRICRGEGCIGDGPEDAFTLAYGRSVRVGGSRCTSRRTGISCVVIASGQEFRIARQGVSRIA